VTVTAGFTVYDIERVDVDNTLLIVMVFMSTLLPLVSDKLLSLK